MSSFQVLEEHRENVRALSKLYQPPDMERHGDLFLGGSLCTSAFSPKTALELLTILEKQDLLAKNKLDLLKDIFSKRSPELLGRVNRYEQSKGESF